ncbi:MAG TPA: crosslink repair DNA glycosylase YcaQ family protein [Kofleriaceae bacterium]|nr:crosslink repair DNA glycosylase YcaQ family protein [Kofleriaceae bacterium]
MKLSAREARAIALAAQGFAEPRPAHVDTRRLRATVDRLGVVQIDSVNVLVRSHYLPAFSRLGGYDVALLDRQAHRAPRSLFEYWGHEASLLPVTLHPLLRWRMARAREHAWGRMRRIARKKPQLLADILAIVAEQGPVSASEIEPEMERGRLRLASEGDEAKRRKGWWEWSEAKTAIEFLFWSGQVTSARRRGFERLYDLPERVLPAKILAQPTPSEPDAQRALVDRAARALGIATEADLRDYYRLPLAATRTALAELVEAGTLERVTVEGWPKPGYLHREAPPPPRIDPDRTALLSPFDSLVWFRERTARLFGMRYRIEIYVPAPKRVHGYYVLPLLLGDRLVARVDLKADRAAGALRVQAAHAEPGVGKPRVAKALGSELARMAAWLGLARVEIAGKGDLAPALARSGRSR